jgi:hypothetical protein
VAGYIIAFPSRMIVAEIKLIRGLVATVAILPGLPSALDAITAMIPRPLDMICYIKKV